MTTNSIIPKERLSAYQRWELAPFEDIGQAKTPATALPTAEQLESIHQQAREEGFAVGCQEGKRETETLVASLKTVMDSLTREVAQFDQTVAHDLLALSLEVARQMVRQALKARPEIVIAVVREAVDNLPAFVQPVHLILHPADAELVRTHVGEQLSHSDWKLHEDARVERGGCKVESAGSQIDATLAARWQHIVASLGRDTAWLE